MTLESDHIFINDCTQESFLRLVSPHKNTGHQHRSSEVQWSMFVVEPRDTMVNIVYMDLLHLFPTRGALLSSYASMVLQGLTRHMFFGPSK